VKTCSLIYVDLDIGPVFFEGNVNNNTRPQISISDTEELQELTDELKASLPSQTNDETIQTFAKQIAQKHGYKLTYSDYSLTSIAESLNKKEAKQFLYKLKHNIITFKYHKLDGTIRTARGTLSSEIIGHPDSDVKKATKRRRMPDSVQVYFDIDKNGFRCFRKSGFIKTISMKKVEDKKAD
jgi:hypothetical protein